MFLCSILLIAQGRNNTPINDCIVLTKLIGQYGHLDLSIKTGCSLLVTLGSLESLEAYSVLILLGS